MKRVFWLALTGLVLLAGCGAGEPPRTTTSTIDLTEFWRASS